MASTLGSEADNLVDAASQLSREQFEQFLCKVAARRRLAKTVSPRESELLQKISEGMPPDVWKTYQQLLAKKERGELTPDDEDEVARVVDRLENHLTDRVRYIAELAGLRSQSVSDLMKNLELESGDD